MQPKAVVITGATGRMGRPLSLRLAGMCSTLFVHARDADGLDVLCRDLERLNPDIRVVPLQADFADLRAVRQAAERVHDCANEVDLLVNKVERRPCRRHVTTADGFEVTFQVNHVSPALWTLSLLDLLRAGDRSRVVTLVPTDYRRTELDWDDLNSSRDYRPSVAYRRSKLALAVFTHGLARRLAGTGCEVLTVDAQHRSTHDDRLRPSPNHQTTAAGCDVVLHACLSERRLNGVHLRGYALDRLPAPVGNPIAERRLWRTSSAVLQRNRTRPPAVSVHSEPHGG